jgi:hypothetical protein
VEKQRTPLYDFHIANDARMVPFAGWDMPVQYAAGIKAEHLATRNGAGLFDVSHMVQVELSGNGADAFFERLTPTDIGAVAEGRVRYSMLLNDAGGILDDLMVARLDGRLHLVVNAGRAAHDIDHLRQNLDDSTKMDVHHDWALLALQGPKAAQVLSSLGLDLDGFRFMDIRHIQEAHGISNEDIAKRLIDYGFHAPTMSFPVAGTLMIEPTESESLAEIDRFCDAMIAIAAEIQSIADGIWPKDNNPLVNAPHTADDIMEDDWTRPYSRKQAGNPDGNHQENKYWPPVNRVNNALGDRALICACPPMEFWEQQAAE